MSDDWIHVIPADPAHLPSEMEGEQLVSSFSSIAPRADYVKIVDEGRVTFVSAGGNLESIHCNHCGADIAGWWPQAMDRAASGNFSSLATECPTCRRTTSLNDLAYDWPQGFARWRVEARNPEIGKVTKSQIDDLEAAVGCPVRVIYTHI